MSASHWSLRDGRSYTVGLPLRRQGSPGSPLPGFLHFSFLKHAACYAVGRSLTCNELVFLQEQGVQMRSNDYRMQELLRFVIKSDLFLKK